ncbi:MAG: hypothetical protein J0M02_14975, partial [Planctomycetes bacterium]|nr:hypothetical protein [Planctomycetota bacterium]
MVRERLAADQGWNTFTSDQRRWVCPYCLAAVARRPQRSWEDSIGAHLELCRHYGGGRFSPQPAAAVQSQLSFENMVCRAETDAAWQVFDSGGVWICPSCLDRVPDARLVANQRNTLTYRGMALHLQRCAAYGSGNIHPPQVVRAAKDRSGTGNTRATTAVGLPARTPMGGAPAQRAPVATPVGMPVPQVPEALNKGVIDGTVIPWEVVPAIKVHELVKFHSVTDPKTTAFYTAVFIFAMNKAKYNALPPDLKKVIDANSGADASAWAGKVFGEADAPGRKMAENRK